MTIHLPEDLERSVLAQVEAEIDRAAWQGDPAAMSGHYRILPAADRDPDEQSAYMAYMAERASLETALRFYDAASSTFSKIACPPGGPR